MKDLTRMVCVMDVAAMEHSVTGKRGSFNLVVIAVPGISGQAACPRNACHETHGSTLVHKSAYKYNVLEMCIKLSNQKSLFSGSSASGLTYLGTASPAQTLMFWRRLAVRLSEGPLAYVKLKKLELLVEIKFLNAGKGPIAMPQKVQGHSWFKGFANTTCSP